MLRWCRQAPAQLSTRRSLGIPVFFSGATRVPSFVGTDGFSRDVSEVVYGASVLLFGGLGLIIAFVVEMRLDKGKDKRS